jgi:glycosyltransferase involved in cell wall biosynthesis
MNQAAHTPPQPLHIIEPTLSSHAGHCMSLVKALAEAAAQAGCIDVTVWSARQLAVQDWTAPARIEAHFVRRWRRLQGLVLYRGLLQKQGRILVATAGSTDLVSLDWAARSLGLTIPDKKVSAFVHWLNIKPGKAGLFKAIAKRHPGIQVLAPTARVVEFFRNCGFQTKLVPYPLDTVGDEQAPDHAGQGFRHLLVPGAARIDKGFDRIVDLVEAMNAQQLRWPIIVQTSIEHGHHRDPDLSSALARLRSCQYSQLTMQHETLDRASYRSLFDGAIVIQPYRPADFQDRVSGVTLDALQAGAPVVVTDGTWMSRLVQRHHAGVVASDLTAQGLIAAIQTVLTDHAGFALRAQVAAVQVQAEHSARNLMAAVLAEN